MRVLAVVLVAAAVLAADAEEPLEPELVRPLLPVERGRNDSNPVWSPAGDMIAFALDAYHCSPPGGELAKLHS